ncbi:MAG: GNAT family N-acetyltransferase [Lachnospiraceae bacterium]|nr:GNAT family N-acetyltransferase [Lachnospiraceae bacterium]
MELEIVKNYRENETLRHSFEKLAQETFGIDFESWYQNGFWTNRYNPYSVLLDGEIVANVSVNQMKMRLAEKEYHFIQLGTVMTYEKHRNKGYIRRIMEEIEKDYAEVDGFYLFGNDSVLDFYPKFGFKPAQEFQMVKGKVKNCNDNGINTFTAKKVPMETPNDWEFMVQQIEKSVPNSRFEMVDNSQLAMFYLSSFMKDNVYFVESENAYVVAEVDGTELLLTAIYAEQVVDLDKVIAAFGNEIEEVKLGFTPLEDSGFETIPYKEEDCTLFLKGNAWEAYRKDKLRFPELSHA